jgi:Domain of unknown function (DUF4166)
MVYGQLLKGDLERLAPVLRRLHGAEARVRCAGPATVRHHRGWLARLAGFPKAGENIPLQLEVTTTQDREMWSRTFGGALLRSSQWCENGQMVEQMGPVRMYFKVFTDGEDLRIESVKARYWGVPVPFQVKAVERGRGANTFDFEVHVKLVGSYAGVLELLP